MRSVRFDVQAWDAVAADVDISIAGMFQREKSGASLAGGLLHLNTALGGALLRLRVDGVFNGDVGEMLTLSNLKPPMKARMLMMIGLGDPDTWSPATLSSVVATALQDVACRGAVTASFVPSLLDSGLAPGDIVGAAEAMVHGARAGLGNLSRKDRIPLVNWSFGTGAEHLQHTVTAMRAIF